MRVLHAEDVGEVTIHHVFADELQEWYDATPNTSADLAARIVAVAFVGALAMFVATLL
jgi:hypothetical protein